jgi:hypothetical protein
MSHHVVLRFQRYCSSTDDNRAKMFDLPPKGDNGSLRQIVSCSGQPVRFDPRGDYIGPATPSNHPGPPSNHPGPPSNDPDPPSNHPGPPSNHPGPPSNHLGPPSNHPGPPSNHAMTDSGSQDSEPYYFEPRTVKQFRVTSV